MDVLDRKCIYFLKIAELGSLQRASRSLGLTQPALSTAMKKLEGELSIKLFERHRLGLSLSTEGQHFHRWLSSLRLGMQQSFSSEFLEPQKILRIGGGFFLLEKYLRPLIQKTDPSVKVQIVSRPFRDLLKAVEMGLLDFAFIAWDGNLPSPVESRRLFDCPCAIVGKKGVHDHIQSVRSFADLKDEFWVVETDAIEPERWIELLRNRKGMLLNQHHLFRESILAGEGIAEIEVHYFSPAQQKKLVYSLAPSTFKNSWYGVIFRNSLPDHLRSIAQDMATEIQKKHRDLWPGLKNGSPKSIQAYIHALQASLRGGAH